MKRNMKSGSGRGSASSNIENIDAYFSNDDEVGFTEGEPVLGNSIATFNFAVSDNQKKNEVPVKMEAAPLKFNNEEVKAAVTGRFNPNGITPPINGEHFTVKRTYQLRPSTIRKLNELKAKHPDICVYFNTLLDEAILHFYNYIMAEGGPFSSQEDKNITS